MHSILIIEDDKIQRNRLIETSKKCNSLIRIFNTNSKEKAVKISEKMKYVLFL